MSINSVSFNEFDYNSKSNAVANKTTQSGVNSLNSSNAEDELQALELDENSLIGEEFAQLSKEHQEIIKQLQETLNQIREEKRSFQYCTLQLDNTILAVLYRGREILSACIWVEGELRDIVTPEQNERADRLFEELELERQTAREEKELTERKRQEYEQLLRQYAGEIRYVKQKYDELAEYAAKLQRAVKQWREQYMEEIDI